MRAHGLMDQTRKKASARREKKEPPRVETWDEFVLELSRCESQTTNHSGTLMFSYLKESGKCSIYHKYFLDTYPVIELILHAELVSVRQCILVVGNSPQLGYKSLEITSGTKLPDIFGELATYLAPLFE